MRLSILSAAALASACGSTTPYVPPSTTPVASFGGQLEAATDLESAALGAISRGEPGGETSAGAFLIGDAYDAASGRVCHSVQLISPGGETEQRLACEDGDAFVFVPSPFPEGE